MKLSLAISSLLVALGAPAASNAYLLPDLPYPCDALEPFIDTPTMVSLRDEV